MGLIAGIVIILVGIIVMMRGSQSAASGAIIFLIGTMLFAPSLVLPLSRIFSPLLALGFAREGELARGNVIRQPGRAAITASTLMIGLAMFIALGAIVNSFNVFVVNLVSKNFISDVMIVPPTVGLYGNIVGADEGLLTKLRALPEVQTAAGLRYASGSLNGLAIQVLGIDPTTYPKVSPIDFSQGTPDEAFTALEAGRTVIVNSLAASASKLKLGDSLTLQTAEGQQTYRVVGIATDLLTLKIATLFISQTNMQTDFHKAEDVLLMLNFKPGADKTAALAEVQTALKDYPQFTARLTGEYRQFLVNTTVSALSLFYMLAFLILVPAALGLLNTLAINVLERTREIGIIRAVGGSRKQVQRIVIAEALLLRLFGAVLGIMVGIALSYGFTAAISTIGWALPYSFPVAALVGAVIIALVLGLLASILPARSAARLEIIRALQYE